MRIALGIEYDGSGFNGWQVQSNGRGVQASVEAALTKVADHPVNVVCAGRTDTGVHALNQVVHFDTHAQRSDRSWIFGCNANLPKTVAVTWANAVDEAFHARFSATRRRYRYVIFNRAVRPTFLAYRVTWEHRALDEARMLQAARYLLGEHDFSAFRASECQAKSPVRTVYDIDVQRKDDLVIIDVEANAFLHHMVRNIAGVLISIGAGEQPPKWSEQVLNNRRRELGGVTAPPFGLYLTDVTYPQEFALPGRGPSQLVW
jgi:tRNA pseudouridine38-40 synthase